MYHHWHQLLEQHQSISHDFRLHLYRHVRALGLGHGDIDADGNHEIYFGVAPAAGANDDTWGTYIFEQEGGSFPASATHLLRYGLTTADNFRAAARKLSAVVRPYLNK